AFERMTDRDAFWAAKIVMSFSADDLLAVVQAARYSDPAAAAYVHAALLERQRKCGQTYLNRLNPIDEFRLAGARLEFTNLAEKYGVGPAGATYHATWFRYDDASDRRSPIGDAVDARESALAL